MKKNKITLLDCTLRDGGYYNNWDFPKDFVEDYLSNIIEAKVDYIEIGFRSPPKDNFMGPYLYSTDRFINSLKISNSVKLGVMINANEFILETDEDTENNLLNYFDKKINSRINLVRIAINFNLFIKGKFLSKILKT